MCTAQVGTTTEPTMARPHRALAWFGALLALGACAQKPFAYNDTTFLLRDFRNGYHAVFIAAESDSIWYRRIASPPGDMRRHGHVRNQQRMLGELGIRPAPPPVDGSQQPVDLVGAVRSGAGCFLYAPSDWMNHRQQQLVGGWLITNETDGPLAHAIVERREPMDGAYLHLRCVSMVSHALDPQADTVDVRAYRIDEASGIELWEHTDSYGDARYELMVPLERARGLPIIVNHAPARKAPEFQFEEAGPRLLGR